MPCGNLFCGFAPNLELIDKRHEVVPGDTASAGYWQVDWLTG
ncbi:hypothetical protein [Polaromonas sp. CG9_12]|nr:hypothetical protein [Polaromonas sp. CG9_12]